MLQTKCIHSSIQSISYRFNKCFHPIRVVLYKFINDPYFNPLVQPHIHPPTPTLSHSFNHPSTTPPLSHSFNHSFTIPYFKPLVQPSTHPPTPTLAHSFNYLSTTNPYFDPPIHQPSHQLITPGSNLGGVDELVGYVQTLPGIAGQPSALLISSPARRLLTTPDKNNN